MWNWKNAQYLFIDSMSHLHNDSWSSTRGRVSFQDLFRKTVNRTPLRELSTNLSFILPCTFSFRHSCPYQRPYIRCRHCRRKRYLTAFSHSGDSSIFHFAIATLSFQSCLLDVYLVLAWQPSYFWGSGPQPLQAWWASPPTFSSVLSMLQWPGLLTNLLLNGWKRGIDIGAILDIAMLEEW